MRGLLLHREWYSEWIQFDLRHELFIIVAVHFVSASIYHKAKHLALGEGLSPDLFAHHQQNGDPQSAKYIPIDLLFEIYELADQHLASGFGVRQGQQLNSEDYGTLGLSWRTCWMAKEVFDRIERFMVLVTDHGHVRVEESGGNTTINLSRDVHRRGVAIANEATFVMVTGVLKEVTGKKIHPVNVQFKHHCSDSLPFSQFFHCPVEFGMTTNTLRFTTSDIDIPTLKADKSINQFLVERMDEEKKGIQVNADQLLLKVHKLVTESLPGGIPSVTQTAEHLGMSARTLKRRLADKGQTFREFVQTVQQELAVNLIKRTDQSIAEIAFQTGFSEQSAFNRAFKRWVKQAPVDYRKQLSK